MGELETLQSGLVDDGGDHDRPVTGSGRHQRQKLLNGAQSMIDEQDFKKRVDEALASLHRALVSAADDYGFDVDFNAGALGVEFEEPPAKFVISPNAPVRQIWVS